VVAVLPAACWAFEARHVELDPAYRAKVRRRLENNAWRHRSHVAESDLTPSSHMLAIVIDGPR
jgi:hypothetical protein